jgi:membrane protease subunit HflK
VARAEGETARFTKLLSEYQKAPDVTRERLYLDAVESVLAHSSKVMVDVSGGNNLLYLPLDQLIQGGAATATHRAGSPSALGGGSSRSNMDSRARRPTHLREGR